jgi:nucleoside 2-deoxyribosyltransferase
MRKESFKIYCAGPLFNPSERNEMKKMSDVLKSDGYGVFLPQEDGLEFAKLFPFFIERGLTPQQAQQLLNRAIFALDVFQIIDSDGLILNMNGRVPDEGAMVEAGIAWSHNKPVVIFNSDERSLIQGNCNPLVIGLSNFETVSRYEDISKVFDKKFKEQGDHIIRDIQPQFEMTTKQGQKISKFLYSQGQSNGLADLLIDIFGGKVCQNTKGQIAKST